MARPIPRLAPVTRATCPFRLSCIAIPFAVVRIMGRTISVFGARRIASHRPASAGLVPAERQRICYRRPLLPHSPSHSHREWEGEWGGIYALAGSWPVVIPTGASPAEIGKHRSYFSLTTPYDTPNYSRRRTAEPCGFSPAELVNYLGFSTLPRCHAAIRKITDQTRWTNKANIGTMKNSLTALEQVEPGDAERSEAPNEA